MTPRWRHLIIAVAGAGAALALIAAMVALDVYRFLNDPIEPAEGETRIYTIEPGTSVGEIARQLASRGLIERPLYLRLTARVTGAARRIQAGEYAIRHGVTPLGLLEKFEAGEVKQYSVTIVEGWTFAQMVAALAGHEALANDLAGEPPKAIMRRLGHPDQHPEGRFFPDTYTFTRGTSDRKILQRAYDKMQRVLAGAWQGRADDLPLDNRYEALILASIIERETAVPAERGRIAGVFVERLDRGMRLQTDPTVIYGIGDDFEGDLTYEHLRRDSPYNTYTRGGLPPTPIALPSMPSIEAAVHPDRRGELYFVATGDGGHVFSKTQKAHQRAVRRYQLGQSGGEE
jgi:UPF0755 protein